MERLGNQPRFTFRRGNKEQKLPSVILFDHSKLLIDQYDKITALLNAKGAATYHDIMEALGIDLTSTKSLAREYSLSRQYVSIVDDNKLILNTKERIGVDSG
jgi:hypothetical protein